MSVDDVSIMHKESAVLQESLMIIGLSNGILSVTGYIEGVPQCQQYDVENWRKLDNTSGTEMRPEEIATVRARYLSKV